MRDSTFEQPLPAARAERAAHAHGRAGQPQPVPWHVYPEHAAAGLWTTPTDFARFAIDVQRTLAGPRGTVLTQASAREMTTPVGVGPFAVVMTNGDNGGAVVIEILERIAAAYAWDSLDTPLTR